jgi:hypothetical protein
VAVGASVLAAGALSALLVPGLRRHSEEPADGVAQHGEGSVVAA